MGLNPTEVRSVGNVPPQADNDIVLSGNLGFAELASAAPFADNASWRVLYEPAQPRATNPEIVTRPIKQRGTSLLINSSPRVRVNEPTRYPFSTICALRMWDENGSVWGGTGTIIGKRVVLTAGHNVFDRTKNPRSGWFQEVRVIPGLDGDEQNTPFPVVRTKAFRATNLWTDYGSDEWDLGAVILPSPLGDFTGWMASANLTTGTLNGLAVHIAGYPTEIPTEATQFAPRGTTMWMDTGNVVHVESQYVRYDINTSAGVSGAPAIAVFPGQPPQNMYRLIAVHTESFDAWTNRGVRISERALELILQWINSSQPV